VGFWGLLVWCCGGGFFKPENLEGRGAMVNGPVFDGSVPPFGAGAKKPKPHLVGHQETHGGKDGILAGDKNRNEEKRRRMTGKAGFLLVYRLPKSLRKNANWTSTTEGRDRQKGGGTCQGRPSRSAQ